MTDEELRKKTFAVQSLIGQRSRRNELIRVISGLMTSENWRFFRDVLKKTDQSKSQFLQDLFALALTAKPDGGFFVEFGACDGLHLSNSYLLEKDFGWQGILAEPGRKWLDDLRNSRSASIDTRCVSKRSGDVLRFFEADNPGQSTVDEVAMSARGGHVSYDVETVSLLDLLKTHNAPRYIDFLSIDCEGHEFEVISGFDFDEYQFGFVCIEQHVEKEKDIRHVLEANGYVSIFPRPAEKPIWMTVSGFDLWFVSESLSRLLPETFFN